MNSKEKRLRTRIRTMIAEHGDIVIDELLAVGPWHSQLDPKQGYRRFADDDLSTLSVAFGVHGIDQGDVYTALFQPDIESYSLGQRWRTWAGGGENLCTRAAFIILARAMQLDCLSRPQSHREIMLKKQQEEREKLLAEVQRQKEAGWK